ncbi:alpha/beta hydrolase [Catenulispora yoronensis]|uniref:alpha/beta hydrolase family protein n=1 Tax=Catenulispora yoronensis TaxID=450799 RepID=UPI0031CFA85A
MTALTVSGCSSSASKSASAGAKGAAASTPATPAKPSPSIEAVCLQGVAGVDKTVTHFPGGNGHTVEAYTTGTGPIGVVLAHQVDSTLCQWSDIRNDFPDKDYTVMAITMGGGIDTDVVKAVEKLRAKGLQKIVLVGASMGGTAVLTAAGEITPPVQAVVSLSGPAGYGNADAYGSVEKFQIPVAFFAGEQDLTFATDAQKMYDAATEKDKTIHILKDDPDHGVDLWPQVKDEVFSFITKHTQ